MKNLTRQNPRQLIVAQELINKVKSKCCGIKVIDKDAVLAVAQEKQIDGIMSFAVDPGVVTAAYVAEQMGLPFQGSYKSVRILQDKSKGW